MVKTLSNEEIINIAEEVGFELNDFGRYNCTEDSILNLVEAIEKFYKAGDYANAK